MALILGFDPGGKGNFGWCVARDGSDLPLRLVETGLSDRAAEAVDAVLAVTLERDAIAVGIDAPLRWPWGASRPEDDLLRRLLRDRGAPAPEGTIQHVNSLQGSCVVQGVLLALALRQRFPRLPITESHPKALLTLLDAKHIDLPAEDRQSEHERDAILAAWSAWASLHRPAGWRDLYEMAGDAAYSPIESLLSYWMPAPRE